MNHEGWDLPKSAVLTQVVTAGCESAECTQHTKRKQAPTKEKESRRTHAQLKVVRKFNTGEMRGMT